MTDTLPAGIHPGIPADVYHNDPAERPSLSAHIAATMCAKSPLHGWAAHPRLNPDLERTDEQKFAVGTAAHALLLQGEHIARVIQADNWRTNAAKEARDAAIADGLIPMLPPQWEQVRAMVACVRVQLEHLDIDPPLLTDGHPEQTLIWEDDHGVVCRARADWLRSDATVIDDLKTTTSARPDEWARRRMFEIGADVQAAMYRRGVQKLTGTDPLFRFLVVECQPPYAVSVIAPAPSVLDLGRDKVQWAIDTWAACTESGQWPAYSTDMVRAEAPPWEWERWVEARAADHEEAQAA